MALDGEGLARPRVTHASPTGMERGSRKAMPATAGAGGWEQVLPKGPRLTGWAFAGHPLGLT